MKANVNSFFFTFTFNISFPLPSVQKDPHLGITTFTEAVTFMFPFCGQTHSFLTETVKKSLFLLKPRTNQFLCLLKLLPGRLLFPTSPPQAPSPGEKQKQKQAIHHCSCFNVFLYTLSSKCSWQYFIVVVLTSFFTF